MSVDRSPCACGAGTVETTFEMDDWNRSRPSQVIHCPTCEAAHSEVLRQRKQNEADRAALLGEAQRLAKERYLSRWLALFEGKSRKAAWQTFTGGAGYPALETFYKHVREKGGVAEYMTWCFHQEVRHALRILQVEDADITDLLDRRDAIPEYKEPHPWQ